ncbi:hypothetical protein E3N88_22505 [Mikania micrantha]|uniref:CCHC-type domain-containing protein n=1 Tax=Mikania micrantha TaxID=192012 RepID=A0A5N6NAW9_9ASTR|nr:hypothetical protein E3N88_22505 [Mikania micrantha]
MSAAGNHHPRRNGRANRDPRDAEIEQLRRRVRELELHSFDKLGSNDSDATYIDYEDDFDNVFANPHGDQGARSPPRHRHRTPPPPPVDPLRALGFRLEIPEFEGRLQPDDFLDWLHTIERVFDIRHVPDDLKVKLVVLKFKKHASLWWEHVQYQRRREGKRRISTWDKLKRLLKKKFLPATHKQDTYLEYHNLKQHSMSVEFISTFERMRMRCGMDEEEEQIIARFLGCLRADIAEVVYLQQYYTFDDVCRLALRVEKQLASRSKTTPRAPLPTRSTPAGSSTTRPGPTKPDPTGHPTTPEVSSHSSPNLRCFKCQGFGHLKRDCPNKQLLTVVDPDSGSDGADDQPELVYPDKGELLVTRPRFCSYCEFRLAGSRLSLLSWLAKGNAARVHHRRRNQKQKAMAIDTEDEIKDEKNPPPLDEDDIALLKTYGLGPYSNSIKKAEKDVKEMAKRINDLCGIKESDTGLAAPSQWDLVSDKQMMQEEQPLQVARCTKIINPNTEDAKYVINVKQIAKFVVGLGDKVSPTDIEEGMRVGVDRNKYQIQIPLPPKIDPSVTMMTVEEKPDVTYNDVGGCKEQIEKMREVVELPMLHPEKFVKLGIDPPKGVLCYGPPGTGKTLLARAVANRTDACFIRVIGSELVQKYVGEGARMVRELFQMARSKKACIVFFDEVDAIGGARFDDGVGGDNEVQRTMLEIVNQLDGFDARGNIKVLMATNRPDTLDPALLRPGRLDRKVEFGLPDMESRTQIFKIHTRTMNCERDIRFELLARLCPNSTGADIRSVCTEAGMYAIRARRKTVTEKDFLDAVNKVIKGYQKFSATPKYMVYN